VLLVDVIALLDKLDHLPKYLLCRNGHKVFKNCILGIAFIATGEGIGLYNLNSLFEFDFVRLLQCCEMPSVFSGVFLPLESQGISLA